MSKNDSSKDMVNVDSHSSDFCLPHSILYNRTKATGVTVPPATRNQSMYINLQTLTKYLIITRKRFADSYQRD
jgi:hypothetical protein